MKEVVWVFGTSASGKATFIKHIVEDEDYRLREQFGWKDQAVVACNESLELIGGDLDEERESILDKVPEILQNADIVLIKWQYVDSQHDRPQRLKQKLPDVQHRIISLDVSVDELVKRLPTKPLWHNYGDERNLISIELPIVLKSREELNDFDVTIIDSSTSSNYEIARSQLTRS